MTRIRYVKNKDNPNLLTSKLPILLEDGRAVNVQLNLETFSFVLTHGGYSLAANPVVAATNFLTLKKQAREALLDLGANLGKEIKKRRVKTEEAA